jgi:uncharacterized LabA/DUF88 family protein
MFRPKTERIQKIAEAYPRVIEQLEGLFDGQVRMYIDYANVRPWADKLGWHIDLKRLKQFLESFDNISSVKLYAGTLIGDEQSESFINDLQGYGYVVKTKPVKIMRISVDASSIDAQSTALLRQFIRPSLLRRYDVGTIEQLNQKFAELNSQGTYFIEDRKCNFDVEIGRDMLIDYERNHVDTFILWSGDSDFADPITQLISDGKRVRLFATSRRVATEINALKGMGLFIFDIQKIKDFICWNREITDGIL